MVGKHHTPITDEIRKLDRQLEPLCRRVGITVDAYKALRFAFRAIGIAIIGVAILTPSIEPSPATLFVLAAFVLGPDVVEAYFTQQE